MLSPARLARRLKSVPSGRPWRSDGDLERREYDSYEQYVEHQAAKLGTMDLSGFDRRYRSLLRDRLAENRHIPARASVLCLAARIGGEVRAFHDLGCFAVGIDLNPGPTNNVVLPGDFHTVVFPDGSADVVFTNSLDHVLDIDRVLGEVARLLRPSGIFVTEPSLGTDEGGERREYEAFYWRTVDALVARIEEHSFELLDDVPFEEPWPGRHLTFRT